MMIRYALNLARKNSLVIKELARRAFKAGVKVQLSKKAESVDLAPYFAQFPQNFEESVAIGERFTADKGGCLKVAFSDVDILELSTFPDGLVQVKLLAFSRSRRDLLSQIGPRLNDLHNLFLRQITEFEAQSVIEMSAMFLSNIEEFDYRINAIADDTLFLRGRFVRPEMELEILDPAIYLRLLMFALKGVEYVNFVIPSPLQMMSILESIQDGIRYSGETYEYYGIRINLTVAGRSVVKMGAGVKPNLGSGFGPASLHLDNLFRSMKKEV